MIHKFLNWLAAQPNPEHTLNRLALYVSLGGGTLLWLALYSPGGRLLLSRFVGWVADRFAPVVDDTYDLDGYGHTGGSNPDLDGHFFYPDEPGTLWCEQCGSYHAAPTSIAHHTELQCKKPYMLPPPVTGAALAGEPEKKPGHVTGSFTAYFKDPALFKLFQEHQEPCKDPYCLQHITPSTAEWMRQVLDVRIHDFLATAHN